MISGLIKYQTQSPNYVHFFNKTWRVNCILFNGLKPLKWLVIKLQKHNSDIYETYQMINKVITDIKLLRENNIQEIIFIHRVENKTAPSLFLKKFCKPSHTYPASFSAHNFLVPTFKLKKVGIEFLLETCYFGTTFWQRQKKSSRILHSR